MEAEEFKKALYNASHGDREALQILLDLYEPLINRSSMLAGSLDEDLRQYIYLKIISSISKFKA